MTTSFPEASYDQLPNSSYPFIPSLGQEFTSRLSTMASQARSNSESYANIATESTTSAVTKFREGAWVILIVIPVLVTLFLAIRRHYSRPIRKTCTGR